MKINILLIDDNPILKNRIEYVMEELIGKPEGMIQIPYVFNDAAGAVDDGDPLYKRMDMAETAFEVKWLKTPKDIKNYLNLNKFFKHRYGKKSLMEHGFIPDLIVFDYSLTEGMYEEINVPDQVRRYFDPIPGMVDFVEENHDCVKLEDRNVDHSVKPNQDTLGLFLSSMIMEIFAQEYPCIGIPITHFGNNLGGMEAEIFEWVVNEYYDEVMEWRGKRKKLWYEIIDFSMPMFRKKILQQIRNSIISINPLDIFSMLNGSFIKKTESDARTVNTITIHSAYGQKMFELDSLFIDINPYDKASLPDELKTTFGDCYFSSRDLEIYRYFKEMAEVLVALAGNGLGLQDLVEAVRISDILWNDYLNRFEDRVELSEFTARKTPLSAEEVKRKKDLYRLFNVTNDRIAEGQECKISKLVTKEKPYVFRLVILHLMTRASVYLAGQGNGKPTKNIHRELEGHEMYYFLNPVMNTTKKGNGLILPMHFSEFWMIGDTIDNFCKTPASWLENTTPKPETKNFFDLGTWINQGEKTILRLFFNEEENLLPSWLK